jgi:hypothetical protein
MKAFAVALLAGIGALSAGSAKATDIDASSGYANSDVQQVRLICNEHGRCYRTRGPYVGPRDRFYDERRYYDRGWDEPHAGIGVYGPGGVGVGIGVDRY